MVRSKDDLNVFECRSCGAFRVAYTETTCCDESMEAVHNPVPCETPELEHVMNEVFGMSPTELEICRRLMAEGEATIEELADGVDRDRSVVWRHLSHLHDLGLVKKEPRLLSEGGRVDVYSPVSEETVRRQLKLGLYVWLTHAVDVVETVNREKIDAMARAQRADDDEGGRELLRQVFGRDGSP